MGCSKIQTCCQTRTCTVQDFSTAVLDWSKLNFQVYSRSGGQREREREKGWCPQKNDCAPVCVHVYISFISHFLTHIPMFLNSDPQLRVNQSKVDHSKHQQHSTKLASYVHISYFLLVIICLICSGCSLCFCSSDSSVYKCLLLVIFWDALFLCLHLKRSSEQRLSSLSAKLGVFGSVNYPNRFLLSVYLLTSEEVMNAMLEAFGELSVMGHGKVDRLSYQLTKGESSGQCGFSQKNIRMDAQNATKKCQKIGCGAISFAIAFHFDLPKRDVAADVAPH